MRSTSAFAVWASISIRGGCPGSGASCVSTISIPEAPVPDVLSTTCGLRGFALAKLAKALPAGDASDEARFLRSFTLPEPSEEPFDHAAEEDRALLTLAEELALTPVEILAAKLASSVETASMVGRAIAYLQRPVGGSRPTIGLLEGAFADLAKDGSVAGALLSGAAVESGLLQLSNENAPLAEHAIAVPVPICLALMAKTGQGARMAWPGTALPQAGAETIPLPPSIPAEAKKP